MIEIVVTGDFCPINRVEKLVLNQNFDLIFNNTLQILSNADLAVTNLECPLVNDANRIPKIGPALKANIKTIEALNYANIKLVTLANNHIMDFGVEGLKSTFKTYFDNGIRYVGAGNTLEEARKPFSIILNKHKLAIINIAENEFSNTNGNYPGANPFSLISNFNDIVEAKKYHDFVIVIFHGGHEGYKLPGPKLKEIFRFFVDAGSDAVIAHHTHCFSGYEIYNNVPIFYGLGNFIFDHLNIKDESWYEGLIVKIVFSKNKTSTFQLLPITQFKNSIGVKLAEGEELERILNEIEQLNLIILEDSKLKESFNQFTSQKSKEYLRYFQPFNNRILGFLARKGILPYQLSDYKRRLYLNLIRCESHRDALIEILAK